MSIYDLAIRGVRRDAFDEGRAAGFKRGAEEMRIVLKQVFDFAGSMGARDICIEMLLAGMSAAEIEAAFVAKAPVPTDYRWVRKPLDGFRHLASCDFKPPVQKH